MILGTLFRQDPALHTLRVSAPVALLLGAMIRAIAGEMPAGFGARPFAAEGGMVGFLFCTAWLCVFFMLVPGHFWMRCSRLNMVLPLPPRQLWLVRFVSLTASLVIPVAFLVLPLSLRNAEAGVSIDPGVLSMIPRMSIALVLMLLLLHVPSPQLHRMRGWEYVAWVVAIAIVMMLVTLVLPQAWWFLVIVGSGVLAVSVWMARALPRAFALHPHEPEEVFEPATRTVEEALAEGAAAPHAEFPPAAVAGPGATAPRTIADGSPGRAPSSWRLLHVTIARTLNNHFLGWLNIVLILLYAGILVNDYANGMTPLPRLVLVYIWAQAFFAQALSRLHKLEPWPVSRRVLFAHAMLPGLVAALLAVGVGAVITGIQVPAPSQVRYDEHQIEAPIEVQEIAEDGRPPTIVAPWGESHTPRAYRILRGREAAAYNPFETGEDSSVRFIAWQLDRAVAAVHGGPMPQVGPDAYSGLSEEFKEGIEAGSYAVRGSQGRGSDVRSRTFALSVVALAVLITLLFTLSMQQHRPGLHRRAYGWTAAGFVVLGVAAVIGTLLAERWSFTDAAWALGMVPVIRLRELATAIPVSTPILWLLATGSVALGYLIGQERFARIEAPTKPVQSEFSKTY